MIDLLDSMDQEEVAEMVVEHCSELPACIADARTAGWMCDVSIRGRSMLGGWEEQLCHSSVLAALSPVLRTALESVEAESEQIVIISELCVTHMLAMIYTGEVITNSRTDAREVWGALTDMGVSGVEVTMEERKKTYAPPVEQPKTVMTIMLGVDHNMDNIQTGGLTSPCLTSEDSLKAAQKVEVIHKVAASVYDKRAKESEVSIDCPECNDRFATEINLRTHLADFHMILRCKECGLQVKGNNNLVKHTVSNHPLYPDLGLGKSSSTSPTCDICKETFVTNQALKFHQYKHTGLKPYKCKVCNSFFRTPSTLKSHVEVQHTDSKNKCSICGLKSSTSGKLKIHMRIHTNEKPYQCSFCPGTFKQLSVLKVHEFTHTKKSNYKCDKCGNFFPTKNRLINHKSKPVCIIRTRCPLGSKKAKKMLKPSKLNVLGDLDTEFDNTLDKVTYFIQNDTSQGDNVLTVQQLSNDPLVVYEQSLAYENYSLNNLETGEMPVLVDNLPVIIETDIGSRHLEHDNEEKNDELEKHEEIMFNL